MGRHYSSLLNVGTERRKWRKVTCLVIQRDIKSTPLAHKCNAKKAHNHAPSNMCTNWKGLRIHLDIDIHTAQPAWRCSCATTWDECAKPVLLLVE